MLIKLKLIFCENTKQDGTKWVQAKTILNDGRWVNVRFGEEVNEKLFKNKNQLLTVKNDDVEVHLFEPFTDESGKKVYPFIRINKIIANEILKSNKSKVKATQELFSVDVDEEPTPTATIDDDVLPFDEPSAAAVE